MPSRSTRANHGIGRARGIALDRKTSLGIVGVDNFIVAPVQSFADYNYDQIEWNRRFVEIYAQNEAGDWTADYDRIDEIENIAPIQNRIKTHSPANDPSGSPWARELARFPVADLLPATVSPWSR